MLNLVNKSRIKDSLLDDIIWFVAPADIEELYTLTVLRGVGYDGKNESDGNVTIFVPPQEPLNGYDFSHETDESKGYVGCRIRNETERLVHLIAHELRHVWQRKNFETKKGWHHTSRYKRTLTGFGNYREPAYEYDADVYARKMLKEWRQQSYV